MSMPGDAKPQPSARAVALRYDRKVSSQGNEVPQVVARGQARVAEAILALAREHRVPVREDRDLVALLSACDVGSAIPVELYSAVAELLVWVYRTNSLLAPAPESGDSKTSSTG
jgi:flagellar biosynthesis protein